MFGTNGYSLGMIFLYVFFWIRLQVVFEETSMRLSIFIKIFFVILLLIQLITTILSTYYFMLGWNETVREAALRYWTMFTWTNIFSSTLVLVVFTKQIFSVIMAHKIANIETVNCSTTTNTNSIQTIEGHHVVDTANTNDIGRNQCQRQHKIWRLMMRCMICAMVALLSTIVIAVFSTMQSTIPNWHSNLILRGAHIALRIMDETINLICLCLQFPFSKPLYKRLCGKVDSIVSNRVMVIINLKTQS